MTAPHTLPAALDVAATRDLMSADEARSLLAAMTPGTLEVAEIRDGRLIDAAPQELAVVIHDDARAHQKPDGTWHSVVVCRGMDGPTRDANADAFAAVKRALETVAALAAQHAADVADAVAAARDDERERAASVAESHAIDCDLDAEDERTNGTLGGRTVAQDRAKLARIIRDGIRKPACAICEEPATCFGSSEGDAPSYHCDDCCGHGGEDGHCEPVGANAIAAPTGGGE